MTAESSTPSSSILPIHKVRSRRAKKTGALPSIAIITNELWSVHSNTKLTETMRG